jgi:small subunit ribosomal protein S1
MSPDNSINTTTGQSLDDAYWQALFAEEDTVFEPAVAPPEPENFSWPEVTQNGQAQHAADKPLQTSQDPWKKAQEIVDADEVLELEVSGFNKGGLLVYWNGLQGFIPASQLVNFPQFHFEAERTRALKKWLHKTLKLKIVELNAKTNRLIFSERAAGIKAEDREQLFEEICPGDQLDGVVTNLTGFGAFVDLGGAEGLIHISELSWSRVVHPSDIVQPGQQVSVMVMNVNREQDRIALSMKRLKPDPWRGVEKRYRPGQMVTGVVNNVVKFGAFVQLEDELEGLIHISELAEGSFLHPRNVVQKGQEVTARVLSVDGPAKRLALSLRLNGTIHEE